MTKKASIDTKWKIIGPIVLAIIGAIIWNYQEHHDMSDGHHGEDQETIDSVHAPKSEAEVNAELFNEGVDIVTGVVDQINENNRIRDSIFEATKPQRFVCRIGDWMTSDESILALAKQLDSSYNYCLFEEDDSYFFFINEDHDEEELEIIVVSVKEKLENIGGIQVTDIMQYYSNPKEKFEAIKPKKVGKRKNKIAIPCYAFKR